MNFPLNDFVRKSELHDTDTLLSAGIDRINRCFDFNMQLIFGEDWKAEEIKWGFKRDFVISEDEHKVDIHATLSTDYDSADHNAVNEALFAIRAGTDVFKNRQFLVQCLESEREAENREDVLEKAITNLYNVLGPSVPDNLPSGAKAEWTEALRILKRVMNK